MNILIVEDNVPVANQLAKLLKSEKYSCDVAYGYLQAKELLDKNAYSILLLDWNLGDGDGLELLKEIRFLEMDMPVLMLSANSEINERVRVLDAGADDYLCKPYSNIELLARMRVLLRKGSKEKSSLLKAEDVTLDISTHEVFVSNLPVQLTAAEFDLLELFMKNQNIVLTRYQLSEHINKDNYSIKHSNLVDVHIKNLRKKLDRKDLIQNVRGIGYKINKSS
ncbi:MAG: response regulator transcription factor [Sulfurimonas sp.]|nr:response regulator transcription factor [Sulfurimonas sp.]MDD3061164.1 response regulator transcription factor [Sulfurimonas sp.]MDD5202481.1 response regulator transcription factor [Sulfurimonas sp.]